MNSVIKQAISLNQCETEKRKRISKMAGNFGKQTLKIVTMLFLVWIPLTNAFPSPDGDEMQHNDNYDMIMPDDNLPAESVHLQNFEGFFNAESVANDAMAEMQMEESRLSSSNIRAPQALNANEELLRQHLEELDVEREKRVQRSLSKGSTIPLSNANDWENFDYEI
ncbi:uncharacterized protein ACRADG_009652 [Cochliomyia hominivorax]